MEVQSTEQGVTRTHIAVAISFLAGGLAIGYFIGRKYSMASHVTKLNLGCINMDCDKIVDTIDLEEVGQKKTLCRCWQSKKFPLCDGSHNIHNKKTGDNIGPVIVKANIREKTA